MFDEILQDEIEKIFSDLYGTFTWQEKEGDVKLKFSCMLGDGVKYEIIHIVVMPRMLTDSHGAILSKAKHMYEQMIIKRKEIDSRK